ncbi:MAG: hypothetical protein ACRD5W_01190 [Candidatus Acidiferrales bacterium]
MTEDIKSQWPQPGDSLLAAGPDWENEALLNVFVDGFLHYALGYKEAADLVVQATEAGSASRDAAGLAVCFMYRQYLELMLKGLINLGRMLEHRTSGYPPHHRIADLWKECRELLEKAFPEGEKGDTDAVEECIKELAGLDPVGEAFRYAADKKRAPSLTHNVQLNLRNIRDVMARMNGYLTGSYDALDELVQAQADMDSYYAG